jgi:hypothetical protein
MRKCESGGELSEDDSVAFCNDHICPMVLVASAAEAPPPVPPQAPKDPETGRRWSKDVCWHCGERTPSPENMSCLEMGCRKSLVPPAVHIRFPHGDVEVQPGERVELGRHGACSPVFASHPNVSRRHAAVAVDDDGQVWIEALHAVNGTFVNGVEIAVSTRKALLPGDDLRFAVDVPGEVTIFDLR